MANLFLKPNKSSIDTAHRYQPGLAYPGAVPVVAGEAAPAFPGFVAAPAPAAPSSSGDFLAMACAQRVAKFKVGPLHPSRLEIRE